MNEMKRMNIDNIIQNVNELVLTEGGKTEEEQSVFGDRCRDAVWDLTQLVCGLDPALPIADLDDLVRTISVHRADIHQTLSEANLSYFISVHQGSLMGEIVDRSSGQMLHCPIARGLDPEKLIDVFRKTEVLMLSTYH